MKIEVSQIYHHEIKKSYKYEIVLSLANREVNIGEIRNEIEDCIREFNIRSRVAKNVKNIIDYDIKEDSNLLYILLSSVEKLSSPMRGISLLTKLLLEEFQNKEKEKLLNDIIRNKCFFRLAQEPKEITNLKLEKMEEIKQVQENVSINEDVYINEIEKVKENIDLVYLKQLCKSEINTLINFLISSEISEDDRKKIYSIEKILKGGEINERKV